jgi:hypothetical protein
MGAKAGLEYEARNVRIADEKWGPSPAVAKAANDMATDGWTLVSCSHPHEKWALLTFSRPRRRAAVARRAERGLTIRGGTPRHLVPAGAGGRGPEP